MTHRDIFAFLHNCCESAEVLAHSTSRGLDIFSPIFFIFFVYALAYRVFNDEYIELDKRGKGNIVRVASQPDSTQVCNKCSPLAALVRSFIQCS